jgi:hypothetical protein
MADGAAEDKRLETVVGDPLREDRFVELAGLAANDEHAGVVRRRYKPETEHVGGLANVAHDADAGKVVAFGENDLVEVHRPEIMYDVGLRRFAFAIAEVLPGNWAPNKSPHGAASAVLALRGGLSHLAGFE